jgi:Ricin-type beta-trefoil lectin domain
MKLSKSLATIALTATLSISSNLGVLKPKKSSAQQTIKPIAIIVNGYGDCCSYKMERVISELQSINAEIIFAPWNSLWGEYEGNSALDDARFLREVADYVNNNVDPNQPVILIGHSFGGDSVLKVAPRINRRILFLGILDPVAALGKRSPVTGYGVPSNVDYFFNRWQTKAPWPIDFSGEGTVRNCSARECDQQEQSFAKNADGSEIRRACRPDESCRNRSGGDVKKGIDFLGDVIRDDYGTAAKRLLHEPFPTDAYIQQQIVDKIRTLVANYQPAPPPVAGYYHILNKVSNLCLGVMGVDGHGPGVRAEVYHCNPGGGDAGHDNQWTIQDLGNGYHHVTNRVSNLCLGVVGVDNHPVGERVEVYHCNPGNGDAGNDNQWEIKDLGNGYSHIVNKVSGLCLGVLGVDGHGPGVPVEVFHCNPGSGDAGNDNQWTIRKIGS